MMAKSLLYFVIGIFYNLKSGLSLKIYALTHHKEYKKEMDKYRKLIDEQLISMLL